MREYFISRSGLRARIVWDSDDRHPPSFSKRSALHIYVEGSSRYERVIIELKDFPKLRVQLESQHQINLNIEGEYRALVYLAALHAVEQLDTYPRNEGGSVVVSFELDDLKPALWPVRLQDRELRVFLARRMYDEVSRKTLRDPVTIDSLDFAISGAKAIDFIRAAQVLEEEAYLKIGLTAENAVIVESRALLVRDVERYGAPKLDSAAAEDLIAALAAYPVAKERLGSITLEYRRFTTATTHQELVSVFKANAPEVEGLARAVLRARGVTGSIGDLGSIIQEFTARELGGLGLVSQLRYVQKFARDVVGHGEQLPDAVLRIACANAFALLPELAALSV